ncbi:MAG: phosphoribosylaminoimidazolesuccinocarboxamide synthase [Deltaproteobacteria bacterium]|nr:phosphoribosylaminoimidazolesuccinocarboxamide synthase [Deltaproteobacteria bacterium]
MLKPLHETRFSGIPLLKQGKVRDIYDLGDTILIVATDRISAFDVIMAEPIPGKGKILTAISLFWFDVMENLVPNHLVTSDVSQYPEACLPYAEILAGRSMVVKKAQPLPIECVVRGYISGSGWKSYLDSGKVCGITLPEGLLESDRLSEPIFTPSTKAELGDHDINITFEAAADIIGRELAEKVRKLSLAIYDKGARLAAQKGIIIADTKFEFGFVDEQLILIDEVLTPDSSRFWPKSDYHPGGPQKSYDKQYLRDYLDSLEWEKRPPAPSLPPEVIENTRLKYLEAQSALTGKTDEI